MTLDTYQHSHSSRPKEHTLGLCTAGSSGAWGGLTINTSSGYTTPWRVDMPQQPTQVGSYHYYYYPYWGHTATVTLSDLTTQLLRLKNDKVLTAVEVKEIVKDWVKRH